MLLALLLIPVSWVIFAQDCKNFDSFKGMIGETLKRNLHDQIVRNHVKIPYRDDNFDADSILIESDKDPKNVHNVVLVYTGWTVNANLKGPNNKYLWYKEHVWSVNHIDKGYTSTPSCDLHNLKPINPSVNSSRSDEDFDNGGKPVALDSLPVTFCFSDTDSWEPRIEDKGDVARIMFYMDVRYEGTENEQDLVLVDEVNTAKKTIPGKMGFHGKLSTLLEWNHLDPVDEFERHRNEVICKYQHNRNPFIDHPEFADLIWGKNVISRPGSLLVLYPVPASDILNIIWNGKNPVRATLLNSGGGAEMEIEFSGSTQLDVSRWRPGIYFISLTDGENSEGKKVIVRP